VPRAGESFPVSNLRSVKQLQVSLKIIYLLSTFRREPKDSIALILVVLIAPPAEQDPHRKFLAPLDKTDLPYTNTSRFDITSTSSAKGKLWESLMEHLATIII
jgi:hypothetical protein